MALLISLESSTQVCSVAVHNKGSLLAHREVEEPRKAASLLAICVQQVLAESHIKPGDLQGVVVTSGPGSFTGLRIGVATAKGICFGLSLPLVAINTLDLLIHQALNQVNPDRTGKSFYLCPMLDARRMEVYCKIVDAQLHEVEPTQARIIDSESFDSFLENHTIYFFGEGADKCQPMITHPNAIFLKGIVPQARELGVLGYVKWQQSQFEALDSFEPFYLKDFLIRKPSAQ